jgi:hypothetical protein
MNWLSRPAVEAKITDEGVPVQRAVYCDMQGDPLWTYDPYPMTRMEAVGDYVNKFMIPYRVRRVAVCEGTMYVNLEEEKR